MVWKFEIFIQGWIAAIFLVIDINLPIKLVYVGRLIQDQKRILDLPKIMQRLLDKGVKFEFNIIGNGPEEKIIKKRCRKFVKAGLCKFHGLFTVTIYDCSRNFYWSAKSTSDLWGKYFKNCSTTKCVPIRRCRNQIALFHGRNCFAKCRRIFRWKF